MVSSGDFRVYMRQLAGWVWKEQAAAHSFGLSLQEETITEILLLEMAKKLSPLGLNVTMFSKPQEGGRTKKVKVTLPNGTDVETQVVEIEAEGADWEWFVRSPDGCMVSFRVQAKKLYHDIPNRKGRYGGFHAAGAQIDTLIARANAIGSNPIYVLYNHPDVTDASLFGPTRQPDFFGRDCWGCAVTTAQFMKHAANNKLQTIHRGTVPWHRFFGIGKPCRTRSAMDEIAGKLTLDSSDAPQEFVEAKEMPRWVQMIGNSADLLDYLREESLDGVALLDFSEFRGD